MEGDALISYSGYARKRPLENETSDEEKSSDIYYMDVYDELVIKKEELLNRNNYTLPVEQKLAYSLQLNNTDNNSYFKLNLFSTLT